MPRKHLVIAEDVHKNISTYSLKHGITMEFITEDIIATSSFYKTIVKDGKK